MYKKKSTSAKSAATKPKDERARNWVFIVYPESAPENWRDVLDAEHVPWIESPIHDKDDNADNTQKKHHWHVLLLFEGKKNYSQVIELCQKVMGTVPQKVASAKGLVRYMAHLDNPEKHQYDRSMILGHGGADVAEYLKPTSSSRYEQIREMREWVADTKCYEFFTLFDYAAVEHTDDWFPLLCDSCAYIMGEYIKSRRHSVEGEYERGKKRFAPKDDEKKAP